MENKKTISVILPIRSAKSTTFKEDFDKCIVSLSGQTDQFNELVIVHTDETELVEFLNSYDFGNVNVVKEIWKESPNFCNQINHGVKVSNSEYVSFYEFDDEYSNIWFKNVHKYSNIYNDISAFLPIVVDTNDMGVFVGFTNEATFASNISQEMGYLSTETLLNYQNFQISGMVVKKEVFENVGGLKGNFKLTFGYEFLLRLTNGHKVLTIPKIGYKHTNMREGSIFWNYKNGDSKLTPDEVKFWVESAKKEYFYTNQREINYEPQEV